MSILKLRLDIWGFEGSLPGPDSEAVTVVTNIYDVTHDIGERNSKRNIEIPVGATWEEVFQQIELEPGRYVIEVVLPSGQVINDEVSIQESAEPQEVRLQTPKTSHEWLGWQNFIGNMRQDAESYDRQLPIITHKATINIRTDLVSILSLPEDIRDTADISTASALVSRGLFPIMPSSKDVNLGRPLSEIFPFDQLNPPARSTGPLTPVGWAQDQISQMYFFKNHPESSQDHILGLNMLKDDYREPRFERHYLFIQGENIPPQYCVLPVPWKQMEPVAEAVVQAFVRPIMVDPEVPRGGDPGYRVAISVADRILGSVIGYLSTGALPNAATIVKKEPRGEAKQMLYYKIYNPLAAAAGTYALLITEDSDEPNYWHDWVRNLMNWFPWLPDGAIQHAWVKLRHQQDENDRLEARESLLEGYRRGLPFYSRGVKLLLDGLTLFANDAIAAEKQDEEVEEALRTVRKLALRTSMRQPFTTVLLQ